MQPTLQRSTAYPYNPSGQSISSGGRYHRVITCSVIGLSTCPPPVRGMMEAACSPASLCDLHRAIHLSTKTSVRKFQKQSHGQSEMTRTLLGERIRQKMGQGSRALALNAPLKCLRAPRYILIMMSTYPPSVGGSAAVGSGSINNSRQEEWQQHDDDVFTLAHFPDLARGRESERLYEDTIKYSNVGLVCNRMTCIQGSIA